MAKTSKPLRILIDASLAGAPQYETLVDLETKGHTVTYIDHGSYDLIIGPKCSYLTADMLTQKGVLDVLLKAARKDKRGPSK